MKKKENQESDFVYEIVLFCLFVLMLIAGFENKSAIEYTKAQNAVFFVSILTIGAIVYIDEILRQFPYTFARIKYAIKNYRVERQFLTRLISLILCIFNLVFLVDYSVVFGGKLGVFGPFVSILGGIVGSVIAMAILKIIALFRKKK